jgi:hypothetical protein
MGFMDKVKSTVKSGAEQAATKAQEELERLQTRRELGQAYSDLGEKTFELVDRGDLSHAELGPLVDKARALRSQLESIGTAAAEPAAAPTEAPPAN